MKRYKRTAQVVERLWLLLRLAHRWLHWRVYIGADGAIARLIICRSMRFHRRSPHSIFTRPDQITNSERRRNGRTTLKADNNDLRRSSYVFLSPPHPTAPLPSPQTHAACSPFSIWFTSTVPGV